MLPTEDEMKAYQAKCNHNYRGASDTYERGLYPSFEDAVKSMPIPAELYRRDNLGSEFFSYTLRDGKDTYEFIIDGTWESRELPTFILKAVEKHRAINA